MIFIKEEELTLDTANEVKIIADEHIKEVFSRYKSVDLSKVMIDFEQYLIDKAFNNLKLIMARTEYGNLVGYSVILKQKDNKTSKNYAMIDSIFMLPEHRKLAGSRLLDYTTEKSREFDPDYIKIGVPFGLSDYLAKNGWEPVEVILIRR